MAAGAMTLAHKSQILEITPEVCGELLFLEKIQIENPDKLPFGHFTEFESVLLFDGAPLRFMQRGDKMFFRESVEEMGGMVEYTYLIPLESRASAGHTLEYLESAVGARNTLRKKLLEESERACRGVATRMQKQLADNERAQFENLRNDAKRFIRKGQIGYQTAQVQMLQYILQKNGLDTSTQIEKANAKIELSAQKILGHSGGFITKAQISQRPPVPQKKSVARIKPSEQVERFYTSTIELTEESALEKLNELTRVQSIEPQQQLEFESHALEIPEFEKENEKTILQNENKAIKYHVYTKKKEIKKQNDKSNSKGVEKS